MPNEPLPLSFPLTLPDGISPEEAFQLATELEARLKALTPEEVAEILTEEEHDHAKRVRRRKMLASALAFMEERGIPSTRVEE